ncbi:MAG: sigma-70 family RNA polymerase sigma factor [Deltaproteobacteria bacterium]|nr:sigma-70 family RNA polymerase sigma factor [Deltaproteobacteria bacterium]
MRASKREAGKQGFISQDLQAYIDRILDTPRMSREREVELMKRYREQGDLKAAQCIVEAQLRFVVAIALGYRNYALSMDDLISEGSLGLVTALGKFDHERGTRFVTYASFWIRACILDLIIRSWHSGKQGTGPFNSKIFFKLRRERAKLYSRFGEDGAGLRVLAKSLGLKQDAVSGMLALLDASDVSLDQPAFRDRETTMKELLEDQGSGPEAEAAAKQMSACVKRELAKAMEILDERERYVLRRRSLDGSSSTLAEIGRELGVSRERARQLEERARKKLRKRLANTVCELSLAS